VDREKAREIVDRAIKNGEMLDGIIPVTHNTVE
jgi:(2Fe-2S) ferredoxin